VLAFEHYATNNVQNSFRRSDFRGYIARIREKSAAHGVPRTNEDKRRAVMKLLQDAEWSHWSDREIAKHAKVDGKTVARLRDEIAPKVTAEIRSEGRTFTTKHGTVAKMNTAAIRQILRWSGR
jgi:hypothetical protein